MMRIVFFGSDGLALTALQRLAEQAWCDIVLVVTPPDRPAGRNHDLRPTAVKQLALELGLVVSHDGQPLPSADVGVVVYYGAKIPLAVIDHFPHGIINIHPSLLPRWRGPSPIKSAILHGDSITGVTIMQIDPGFDTGPIFAQNSTPIGPLESAVELEQRLSELGAKLLIQSLPQIIMGKIKPTAQSSTGVTISKFMTRSDGQLQPHESQHELWNHYRAMQPWPGVFFRQAGKQYKITAAHWSAENFVIDCIQPEGKKPMTVAEFRRGYPQVSFSNII